jgi:hypothetical protein
MVQYRSSVCMTKGLPCWGRPINQRQLTSSSSSSTNKQRNEEVGHATTSFSLQQSSHGTFFKKRKEKRKQKNPKNHPKKGHISKKGSHRLSIFVSWSLNAALKFGTVLVPRLSRVRYLHLQENGPALPSSVLLQLDLI